MSCSPGRTPRSLSNTRASVASSHDDLGRRLDDDLVDDLRFDSVRRAVFRRLDEQGHFAELDYVLGFDRLVAGADADGIDISAVGAFEIADHPTHRDLVAEFGVAAADRSVVENDFQRSEPAGSEHRVGFPDLPLHIFADAFQTNVLLHDNDPRSGLRRLGKIPRFYVLCRVGESRGGHPSAAARSMQPL